MHPALDIEFGTYTEWLVEAILRLDREQRIPSACRGTGRPELFDHIADRLAIGSGSVVLDLGSGLGGPGAWLGRARGCRVVGTDVMEIEVRGSARLFPGTSAAVAEAERLPWRDSSFDAAWSLGVVEMVGDKRRAMREVARVLKPGGRVAIYGFFATGKPFTHPPTANHFVGTDELVSDLEWNGLRILEVEPNEWTSAPPDWRRAVELVRSDVIAHHEGDRRLALAQTQLGSFNWLRTSGCIADWVVIAEQSAR